MTVIDQATDETLGTLETLATFDGSVPTGISVSRSPIDTGPMDLVP